MGIAGKFKCRITRGKLNHQPMSRFTRVAVRLKCIVHTTKPHTHPPTLPGKPPANKHTPCVYVCVFVCVYLEKRILWIATHIPWNEYNIHGLLNLALKAKRVYYTESSMVVGFWKYPWRFCRLKYRLATRQVAPGEYAEKSLATGVTRRSRVVSIWNL